VGSLQEALNQFVFSFASRPAQLNRIITFDLLGIPQDYLFRWGGSQRVFVYVVRVG
jgi:hypothetical protein